MDSEKDKNKAESAGGNKKKHGAGIELHNIFQLVAAVAIVAAIVLLIVLVINPMIKYSNASAALDRGEYEDAIEMFGALGSYKDSAEMKLQAEMLYKYAQGLEDSEGPVSTEDMENSYLRAKSYIQNGKYDRAAQILRILGAYKDSASLLEPIKFYGLESGTEITLGAWEQDADTANGAEPVTWTVVMTEEDAVVLMSDKILDCMAFGSGNDKWSGSGVRAFLSGEFYEKAFSADEKKLLCAKTSVTEDNPEYETGGGADCKDTVFLPSIAEYREYILKTGDKKAAPATPYALSKGLYQYEYTRNGKTYTGSWSWLRSAGFSDGYAAICYSDGEVSYGGQLVNVKLGVRPCVRIALDAPEE